MKELSELEVLKKDAEETLRKLERAFPFLKSTLVNDD